MCASAVARWWRLPGGTKWNGAACSPMSNLLDTGAVDRCTTVTLAIDDAIRTSRLASPGRASTTTRRCSAARQAQPLGRLGLRHRRRRRQSGLESAHAVSELGWRRGHRRWAGVHGRHGRHGVCVGWRVGLEALAGQRSWRCRRRRHQLRQCRRRTTRCRGGRHELADLAHEEGQREDRRVRASLNSPSLPDRSSTLAATT